MDCRVHLAICFACGHDWPIEESMKIKWVLWILIFLIGCADQQTNIKAQKAPNIEIAREACYFQPQSSEVEPVRQEPFTVTHNRSEVETVLIGQNILISRLVMNASESWEILANGQLIGRGSSGVDEWFESDSLLKVNQPINDLALPGYDTQEYIIINGNGLEFEYGVRAIAYSEVEKQKMRTIEENSQILWCSNVPTTFRLYTNVLCKP